MKKQNVTLRDIPKNEIAHFAYMLIKEAGICVRCMSSMARPKQSTFVRIVLSIGFFDGRNVSAIKREGEFHETLR